MVIDGLQRAWYVLCKAVSPKKTSPKRIVWLSSKFAWNGGCLRLGCCLKDTICLQGVFGSLLPHHATSSCPWSFRLYRRLTFLSGLSNGIAFWRFWETDGFEWQSRMSHMERHCKIYTRSTQYSLKSWIGCAVIVTHRNWYMFVLVWLRLPFAIT